MFVSDCEQSFPELGLHNRSHALRRLLAQRVLKKGHEELRELLRVLLDEGIEGEFGDERRWVDRSPVGKFHHGEECLQSGHGANRLVPKMG